MSEENIDWIKTEVDIKNKSSKIQELARRFPLGSQFMIDGKKHYLLGYNEPDNLIISDIDPRLDYDAALKTKKMLCSSHFDSFTIVTTKSGLDDIDLFISEGAMSKKIYMSVIGKLLDELGLKERLAAFSADKSDSGLRDKSVIFGMLLAFGIMGSCECLFPTYLPKEFSGIMATLFDKIIRQHKNQ